MDILPTNVSSFRTRSFWNKFYSNPELENFEWYLDIKNVLDIFHKCIIERENECSEDLKKNLKESVVINVGSGNSNLSEVLVEEGFKLVYNLDFSEQVLEEMKKKSKKEEHFVKVDVSKKEYEEFGKMIGEKYPKKPKIIVDKAFLDAFISIDESESEEVIKKRAKAYLEETIKMMTHEDVFIIISISQDYIVKEIIRNTLMKQILIDVYPVFKEERKAHMIQFMYALYKYDPEKIKRKQCKINGIPNTKTEYFEVGQLLKKIQMAKTTIYLGPKIRKHTEGRRLTFDIFPNKENETCFTVVVYDGKNKRQKLENACIIVPTGHEHTWLYASEEGNEELANMAKASRIMLIWPKYVKEEESKSKLNPLEGYSNEKIMKYITENLKETLDHFSLEGSRGVTVMKVEETSKIKKWVAEIPSKYAGKIIIRDLYKEEEQREEEEGIMYIRQMIFATNPQVVQSEVMYREREGREEFMFERPTNEYQEAIVMSMGFLKSRERILILGGGTGVLTNILLNQVENEFEVVELDEGVLKAAVEHFGYSPEVLLNNQNEDQNGEDKKWTRRVLHIQGDGLEYLRRTRGKYACIILDINKGMKEEDLKSQYLMCPDPSFLEDQVVDRMKELMREVKGVLLMNLLTRSNETRKEVLNKMSQKFGFVGLIKTPNEVNEVVVCSDEDFENSEEIFREYAHKIRETKISIRDLDSWVDKFSVYSK